MLASLAAAIAFQTHFGLTAGRFELGERLRALDVAWLQTPDLAARNTAIPAIQRAVSSYFSGKTSEACAALDEARAALSGRRPEPGAAINLRFASPVIEPGRQAALSVTWSSLPSDRSPVRVAVGSRSVNVLPGRAVTLLIDPPLASPELAVHPEGGYFCPVQVGGESRGAYLSIIRGGRKRIERMASAKDPSARAIGVEMIRTLRSPHSGEIDLPYLQWLYAAEQLEGGKKSLRGLDQVPFARHGATELRAAFPKRGRDLAQADQPVDVVIAFHGAVGSENLFFEAYGRGIAALEATGRGWLFVAPRVSTTAYEDAISWLASICRFKIGRVFVIGHSMGCGPALRAAKSSRAPTAAAIFAPAVGSIQDVPSGVGLFLAVGKQEMPALLAISRRMASAVRERGGTYLEFESSEHLMIVADALPKAFRFFDSQ